MISFFMPLTASALMNAVFSRTTPVVISAMTGKAFKAMVMISFMKHYLLHQPIVPSDQPDSEQNTNQGKHDAHGDLHHQQGNFLQKP